MRICFAAEQSKVCFSGESLFLASHTLCVCAFREVKERVATQTRLSYQYSRDIATHLQVVADVLMRNLRQLVGSFLRHGNRGTRRHICFFLESMFPWLLRGDRELATMHLAKAVQLRNRFEICKALSFNPVRATFLAFFDGFVSPVYWKSRNEEFLIPVFFSLDEIGNIKRVGLPLVCFRCGGVR